VTMFRYINKWSNVKVLETVWTSYDKV